MIKLRINPFNKSEEEFKVEGEAFLYDEVLKVIKTKGFKEDQYKLFHVLLDGKEVELEAQKLLKINNDSSIFVAPIVSGGDFGQLIKQIAIIAITVTAYAALGPAAGTLTGALTMVGVSIGATLLLNALIPPPDLGLGSLGGGGDGVERSQMYSLGGQSNQSKPFQVVPKVYGTFRTYPNVVGQPYTSIEVDYSTGKLVQALHVIYDFGLGPMLISELKIGETDIDNFTDVTYRFVDPNKPLIDEGPWDAQVEPTFELYKGDVSVVEDPYSLNLNQTGVDQGVSIGDYQVIRTGPINSGGYQQEISVTVTFPQGLVSYSNTAVQGNVTVELELEFAEEGTEDWVAYNDYNFVNSFSSTGGSGSVTNTRPITLIAFSTISGDYTELNRTVKQQLTGTISGGFRTVKLTTVNYGLPKYTTQLKVVEEVFVQEVLNLSGNYIGSVTAVSPVMGGYLVTIDQPTLKDITLFRTEQRNAGPITTVGVPTGKLFAGTAVLKKAIVTASDTAQYYAEFRFTPKIPDQYKIRLTRVQTIFQYTSQKISAMSYISTTTRFDRPQVNTIKRHTFMELKIRATNQISGTVDSLNAVVSAVIPVYNQTTEVWELGTTSNPAWILADLLTGAVNKKPVSRDRLHMPSLIEWANYADEIPVTPPSLAPEVFQFPRFSCNFILDFSTSLKGIIESIGGATQASLNIVDGKYGVLIDRLQTVPVQVFTPRNYTNFSSSRTYAPVTQGLKVKYNDPAAGWVLTEKVIYNDGFNEDNITEELEELQTFGITNDEQAWRYGRYMLSQAALRQETISIQVDFEYMVCSRGDYVQFTQDVMKVGGRPARVKSISGTIVTVDDGIDTTIGPTYGYVFRGVSGIETSTLTPLTSTTFDLDGTLPQVGDLIVIGVVGTIVFDCIVKAINPIDNLSANITLVEKADAIYTSLETGIVPPYTAQLTETSGVTLVPPGAVELLQIIANSYTVGDGQFNYFIQLGWQAPVSGGITDLFEIYVDSGQGYNFWDTTKELQYIYSVDRTKFGVPHNFKVLAVSSGGAKLNLGEVPFVTATPERKITPPANVSELNINITNQVVQLNWVLLPQVEGVRDYLIRYNPTLEGTWFTSIPLTNVDNRTTSTSAQARKGTYLIKAIDFEGNESADPTIAITSIPGLFDLNIIEEINDAPTWLGVKDRVVELGGSLFLDKMNPTEYYPEGYYYFEAPLDLGLNYTTRLQSLVEAGGFTEGDLMSSWVTLTSVLQLTTSTYADWDVQAQVRINDQINVISNWDPLDDVTSMSEGDIDDWKPYATFIMGDFTAKLYQFRLKLISYLPGVTPEVFDGLIRADMPDRIESFNDIISSVSGTDIVYDPAFNGPGTSPTIQISQDTAQSGDYYEITDKTLDGFTITFYDKDDIAVVRQFDVMVKGYGRKALTYI
jgi:hypothetical protein